MLLEYIAARSRLPVDFLASVAVRADFLYRTYTIPKKDGGVRTIEHPAKKLKFLQRWVLKLVIDRLPVHPQATAYQKGSSIRRNAEIHAGNNFLMCMDFEAFFPSLKSENVASLMKRRWDLVSEHMSTTDLELLSRIVCRRGSLTIGAPSSPRLSNALLYDFDCYWSQRSARYGVAYTRYADDIAFSTNESGVLEFLEAELLATTVHAGGLQLTVNRRKTIHTSNKRKKRVTGLIITPTGRVSIGRHRKREIKSLVHSALERSENAPNPDYLRGLLAFVNACEPSFLVSLQKKYGEAEVLNLYLSDNGSAYDNTDSI